ncbi:MAG TPA: protein kinase [Phototrophicaceae bacterium]|nr:protein kinase [Phototrophicaceae bacterium]
MDRFLGQGGMASVYQATDLRLQRPVAIKVMHPQFASQELFRQRFMQEARAVAALDHPNIVRVLSFDSLDGELFIVMELITGGSLRQYIKSFQDQGQLMNIAEVLDLSIQMADALYYAHQQGLIHRDIKPDNVVLRQVDGSATSHYQPVLTDFGLARLAESGDIYATDQPIGTYPYMSPEQCLAERIDTRSDIYSLGVMFYELTTLRLPYAPRSLAEAVRMHTRDPLKKPSEFRAGLSPMLDRIALKCLEKDPNNRYQTAAEVARDLREAQATLNREDDKDAVNASADPLTETSIDSLTTQMMDAPLGDQPAYHTPQPVPPDQVGFDRIVIYNETEPTVSFLLKKDIVNIGRDSSRDVQLPSRKVSRRHARVERGFDGKYRIVDLGSTNGTYLGDALLIPNIAEVWDDQKTVRMGDYWARLELAPESPAKAEIEDEIINPSRAPSRVGSVPYALTRSQVGNAPTAPVPAAAPEHDRIGVSLATTLVRVTPGSRATLALEIVNQTKLVDHFTITVQGLPFDWYSVPEQALYLFPGTRDTASIEFHPPLSSDSTAGAHAFEVRVSTRAQNVTSPAIQAALDVAPFYDFLADLEPTQIYRRGTPLLTIKNTGNISCTYNVSTRDRSKALKLAVVGKQFTILPGRTEYVDIRVGVKRRPIIGNRQSKNFEVEVDPREVKANSKTLMGELIVIPYIQIWIITSLLVAIGICAIVGALLVPPVKGIIDANNTSTSVASVTVGAASFTPTPTITNTPTSTPTATATPTETLPPTPFPTIFGSNGDICPGSPPSRLVLGEHASVSNGGVPNRLRDQPAPDANQIGMLMPGTQFDIIGGPTCDTTKFLRWWQVNASGHIGWTTEGEGQNYYLDPPAPTGVFGNAFPGPTPPATTSS